MTYAVYLTVGLTVECETEWFDASSASFLY